MADANDIKATVVMEADASQLQSAFDTLVRSISETKEQLKLYKDDKEKSAELTEKLVDEEKQLAQVIKQNNGVIQSSNVTYKQLDDILKDLRKQYKTAADEMSRNDLAPAIKSINSELKGMDASLGDFKRNVGNYEGAIDSAAKNISESFRSVVQTLPSLTESPERFFMALAQSMPKLIQAYKSLSTAQKSAAAASETQVALDKAELTNKGALAKAQGALDAAKVASAGASKGETKASDTLKEAEIAETEVTIASAKADLERIQTAKASIAANEAERKSLEQLMIAEETGIGYQISSATLYNAYQERLKKLELEHSKLVELETQETVAKERLNAAIIRQNELTGANIPLLEGTAVAETEVATASEGMAVAEDTAAVATKGLGAALSSFLLIAVAVLSIVAIFGKDILNWAKNLKIFNDEQKDAIKFGKEWNKVMKEGHQNATKQIVDLQLYSKWAQMASKSDKERTYAAKEVLKTLGSAVTTTNIAKVKNGEYQKSIDDVTKALIKQAQAQAMMNKITEKYKDVIEAQDRLAEAQNGKVDALGSIGKVAATLPAFGQGMGGVPSAEQTQRAMENAVQGSIKRAEDGLKKVQEDFDKWLEKFLQDFNPSDLLFSGGNGPDGDNWFNKWELYIKQYEASLIKLQGEYEELDLASIWKYSAEGLEYYLKMYDEYIEHYSADEKAFKEAQINKQNYLNEFNEYHKKLQKQYMDSTKTELQVEMDKLEEWYTVQVEIYKNAGEDTTALEAEYAKRKQDILDKYVDKYRNADMERQIIDESINNNIMAYNKKMMDLELKNLDDTMDKEIQEYQRKGIETTMLEEHYAIERMKIVSKYEKQNTDTIVEELRKRTAYQQSYNDVNTRRANLGGSSELGYAYAGGTTITGHQQRQNEMYGAQENFNIYKENADAEIQAMKDALESGKIIGEEKLQLKQDIANAEQELALATAEFEIEQNERVIEDARETTQEYLSYAQSAFSGLEGIFNNVYAAIENTLEAQVKQGEITKQEAEKQLKEYRDIQAAAAMMNALSSAVGAYNSMASIPYVGPALGAVAAAAALAAGIANVNLIKATTKDNVGSANNSYANASPSLSEYTPQVVTNVTGRDDTDYLANAMSEKPIKAYVVESEVTAAQEVANQKESETTW